MLNPCKDIILRIYGYILAAYDVDHFGLELDQHLQFRKRSGFQWNLIRSILRVRSYFVIRHMEIYIIKIEASNINRIISKPKHPNMFIDKYVVPK